MLRWTIASIAVAFEILRATTAQAQRAAPVTVTPATLVPERQLNGFKVDIPEAGALSPPKGADGLSVTLGDVSVDGAFPELADAAAAIVAQLQGSHVTLKQIYAAASEIEAAHARAGYVLARVSVPPQDLHDGGALRIVVTDGYVEAVDVHGLPGRVRGTVATRVKALVGRRHAKLSDLEVPLMIANDVPGVSLRSTLIRGEAPGSTRIILEGSQHLLSGSFGIDNSLDPSLGTYGVTAQVSINSALRLGEQIYGYISGDDDISHWFDNQARERVVGGGFILPLTGDGRLSLNPEVTYSRTAPMPLVGAPPSVGVLRRAALRSSYVMSRTRTSAVSLNLGIEQLVETNTIPTFATVISHDRYMSVRAGASASGQALDGSSWSLSAQVSQGLGALGSLPPADLPAGVSYSRQGAGDDYAKLTLQGRMGFVLSKHFNLAVTTKGQTTFSKPVFRAEQFALEGGDAVSAYTGGVTAVDEGITARAELGAHTALVLGKNVFAFGPYVFAACGYGHVNRPTAVEPGSIKLAAVGGGLRLNLPNWGWSLSVEYAHGFSDLDRLDNADRVNVATGVRF